MHYKQFFPFDFDDQFSMLFKSAGWIRVERRQRFGLFLSLCFQRSNESQNLYTEKRIDRHTQ